MRGRTGANRRILRRHYEHPRNGRGTGNGQRRGHDGRVPVGSGSIIDGRFIRCVRYSPYPSQYLFHRCDARFKGLSGPVGTGKTGAIAQEGIKLAYMNRDCMGILAAPTYRMLHDVLRPMLYEILISNEIPYKPNKSEESLYLPEPNATILLRSADDPTKLIGRNCAWFGVDEASYVVEDSWRRLEARLRDPKATHLCGFGGWTPNGLNWIWRRFLSDQKVPGYEVIMARPGENRAILAKTPDYYERLKASYDERFYRQEVLGEYLDLFSGAVYYQWSQENKRSVTFQPRLPICWTLDFNLNPFCSAICQVIRSPHGQAVAVNVLEEISLPGSSTHEMAEEFLHRMDKYANRIVGPLQVRIYGDPAGNTLHTNAHDSDYDIIRQYLRRQSKVSATMCIETSHPLVRQRTARVNGLMCNAAGDRNLWVDPSCTELIADFQEVAWAVDSHGVMTSALNKKNPKRTHMSDALGYLIWTEFGVQQDGGLKSDFAW